MRMMLEGLALEPTEYAEDAGIKDAGINFTVFTYGEEGCAALTDILASPQRRLVLRRGGEQVPVRVREHAIWPPYARRYGDTMQQHRVRLEYVAEGAAVSWTDAGKVPSLLEGMLELARP